MGIRAALLALSVMMGLAPAAAAQTTPGLSCHSDRPEAGCGAARDRRQRELYDMPTLEQLRDQGVEVRRVFFSHVMEWSELDYGALVFERRPGHGPTVRFQLPRRANGSLPEPLVADLTPEAWQEMLERSENLERRFVPSTDGRDVCLFGWDYVLEITAPAQGEGEAPYLYRRAENACLNTSPAGAYVRGLATIAERFFPACGVLRFPGNSRAVSRLPVCAWLEGDRLAAAEVRAAIEPFSHLNSAEEGWRLFDLFDMDAELDWNGARTSGGRAVADKWARNATQSDWPDFYLVSIRGETADRVRVRASLEQGERVDNVAHYRRAPVEMVWQRRGDRFYLRRVTVGPFAPYTPPGPPARPPGAPR